MKINTNWVFRRLHGFALLMRLTDGKLLNLSAKTSDLMQAVIDEGSDIDTTFTQWQTDYDISDIEYRRFLSFLKSEGVLYDEEV